MQNEAHSLCLAGCGRKNRCDNSVVTSRLVNNELHNLFVPTHTLLAAPGTEQRYANGGWGYPESDVCELQTHR